MMWWRKERNGRGDQRPDAGNSDQALRDLVLLGPASNRGIEFADLRLQMGEGTNQKLQSDNGVCGQAVAWGLDDGDQLRSVDCAL
jgi:hypothetical protein